MTESLRLRLKPYIQPFERELALAELRVLTGAPVAFVSDLDAEVVTEVERDTLLDRLAYWEAVAGAESTPTVQVRREATTSIVRNGIALTDLRDRLPFAGEVPIPNRRCLRYGPHGIHEYRGKFFPQLVRALINVAELSPGSVVGDPMCGSGTAVVETMLSRCVGLGLDLNPLSVLLSRTKCELLTVDPDALAGAYNELRATILDRAEHGGTSGSYLATLPAGDRAYLDRWFAPHVLDDLDVVATALQEVQQQSVRRLMWVALSNALRRVSWQKTEDLRVRKEILVDADIDAVREFLDELGRTVRLVLAFLYQADVPEGIRFDVQEGDARSVADRWRDWVGKVDCIITSPPYATALPYLDTDRLSLVFLGLLPRSDHRRRDVDMIGNREVTEKLRRSYLDDFEARASTLPASVSSLVRRVEQLNRSSDVGFRRRNLAALLSKYFLDMREVLVGMQQVLKLGGEAFVVVGNNRTLAGGQPVEIETADLLGDLAESVGWTRDDTIEMDMLVSRDIFRRNAIGSESILRLRRTRP